MNLTAIPTIGAETALMIASEVEPDLSRFPSAAHFCSPWGTRISGSRLRGPQLKRFNRAGQALRLAASTARNSNSHIGACHRTRPRRLDAARATRRPPAGSPSSSTQCSPAATSNVAREIADFEAERRERQIKHLQRQAIRFNLTLTDAAT